MAKKHDNVCSICGTSGVKARFITRTYGNGAEMLLVEGVPVKACPHCGESYMTAETARQIERINVANRSAKRK